jgi:hypothetical protein
MRPVNHLQRFCIRGLLRDSMHSIALFAACCAAAAASAAAFAPAGAALPASRARAFPRVSSRRRIPSPKPRARARLHAARRGRRPRGRGGHDRRVLPTDQAASRAVLHACGARRCVATHRCVATPPVRGYSTGAWLLHARSGRPFRNGRSVARRRKLMCTCDARFAAAL